MRAFTWFTAAVLVGLAWSGTASADDDAEQPPPTGAPATPIAPTDAANSAPDAARPGPVAAEADAAKRDTAAAAATAKPDSATDDFLPTADDPRIPNFLRALRLGEDSLLLGGYIQPGFRYVTDTDFNQDDSDGFDFGNADIIGRGDLTIWEKLGAAFRFDFSVNQGNFNVRDVYGTVSWDKDLVALDIGQLKVPFGEAVIQSEAQLQFPVPARIKRLGFNRDIGVQLRSNIPIGQVDLGLSAMIANGEGGFRQRINIDGEFLYAGRIEVAPLGRMGKSEADLDNSDFQCAFGFDAAYNGALGNDLGIGDAGAGEKRIGGDVRLWFKGLSVRGELIHGFRDATASSPSFDRYSVMAQAGYVLPIPIDLPKFEVVARFEQLDLDMSNDGTEGSDYIVDQSSVRQLQFGANVYVVQHAVKVQFLYQLTDLLEGPMVDRNGNVLLGDTIYIFTQFAWL